MKRQLRSKYGFLIVIGMVLLLFAYTSTLADNDDKGIKKKENITDEVIRKLSSDAVLVGETVTVEYRLSLNNIIDFGKGPNVNSYETIQWSLTFNEKIPEGLNVESVSINQASNVSHSLKFDSSAQTLSGQVNLFCSKDGSKSCQKYFDETFYETVRIKLKAEKPGTYKFDKGTIIYSLTADHSGNGHGSVQHDRAINLTTNQIGDSVLLVEELNIKLPSELELYLNDSGTVNAELSTTKATIPKDVKLNWEILNPKIVNEASAANQSLSVKALEVGTTTIQAVYVHSNKYESKSQPVTVKVKLPDLAIDSTDKVLWVYRNKSGTLVQQQAVLNLTQLVEDDQNIKSPFDATWDVNSTALSIVSSQKTSATVQAEHGSTGNVSVIASLIKYPGQTKTSLIEVKEYPQRVSTPNVVLYMSDSPYEYPVKFWPETSNVTGYGLTVLEGTDVMTEKDGVLTLLKPGIAKIGLVTEEVDSFFPNGDGPEIISQTFYVRVKEGKDPNPGKEEPVTDFY